MAGAAAASLSGIQGPADAIATLKDAARSLTTETLTCTKLRQTTFVERQ